MTVLAWLASLLGGESMQASSARPSSMRPAFRIASIAATLLVMSCAFTPVPPTVAAATIVVVRHAEKATDDPRDPTLNPAGQLRAAALARRLADHDVTAVYATGFRRTRETASPTASAHGLAVTQYDAAEPAVAFANRLRQTHRRGTVLVVGHSNTVPGIVSALCGCSVDAIDESVYDRWYEVSIDAAGNATLQASRY